jgi:hypothetical protein
LRFTHPLLGKAGGALIGELQRERAERVEQETKENAPPSIYSPALRSVAS